MMNTVLYNRLFVVAAAPMNSILCCRLFSVHPFRFSHVFSTEAHSKTLFSQLASTKLNLSEANITRILKLQPQLQNLRTLHKVEKFIYSFEKRGFTADQIANLITRIHPRVIRFAERTFESKLKLLEDFGFVGRHLVKLLMINPSILSRNLLPKMKFLKNIFQSQDVFLKALLRAPRLLNWSLEKILKPSLAYWKEEWGFCGTALVSFLQVNTGVLSCTSLTPAQVDLIHKIGANKESKMFKYIVSMVARSRTKTLEAKIENLKLCVLMAEEALQLLGAAPLVFHLSKETLIEKMNFLVTNMELPANYVVKHPSLLQMSLEKTMKPRFLVWQKIKSINDS